MIGPIMLEMSSVQSSLFDGLLHFAFDQSNKLGDKFSSEQTLNLLHREGCLNTIYNILYR